MSKTVDQRLHDAANLFKQRNEQYGDNYKTIGPVLDAMFPSGILLLGPDEMQRMFTIVMQVTKLTRYAQNIHRGGHQDSLDDMAVYSIMAAHTDDIARSAEFPQETVVHCQRELPLPIVMSLGSRLHERIASGLTYTEVRESCLDGWAIRRTAWEHGFYVSSLVKLNDYVRSEISDWELWKPVDAVDPPDAAPYS